MSYHGGMICQGCNKRIRWWQRGILHERYGHLHLRQKCHKYAEQRDVNN